MPWQFEIENLIELKDETTRLCEFLIAHGISSECIFDSKLIVSELVGNVLKHSQAKATLYVEIVNDFLELVVLSSKPFIPPADSRCSGVDAETGRGLYLVDSVCEERGMTADGGIKVRIRVKG